MKKKAGRPCADYDQKRVHANIRLPRWVNGEIDKLGVRSQVIERILIDYLNGEVKEND